MTVSNASADMTWRGRWRSVRGSFDGMANHWFPDRQLLIRGPGNVTSFWVSKNQQILGVGLLSLAVVWAVIASLGVVVLAGDHVAAVVERSRLAGSIANQQAEIHQLQDAASALRRDSAQRLAQAMEARTQAVAEAHEVVAAYNAKLLLMTSKTQDAISRVQAIIRSTGLNPDHLMPRPGPPKLSSKDQPNIVPDGKQLSENIAQLDTLADLLERMPLATPVGYISVSSPFGFRPDPWTGDREFHVGVDLRGPVGSPVYATARGIVSFAGTQTGYGNIVIIEHGFGLSTRYSHLSKILVHVGADVDLHQEIGLLGSTGWSTGPHLLYETRVDGQPYDPLNFIRVNRYGVQN